LLTQQNAWVCRQRIRNSLLSISMALRIAHDRRADRY
jgi:hypothetical protein